MCSLYKILLITYEQSLNYKLHGQNFFSVTQYFSPHPFTQQSTAPLSPCIRLTACRLVQVVLANFSHRPLPRRKSASRLCCRLCNTGPAGAAAPGPPGSLTLQALERGSWGQHGGCRKHSHRDAVRIARDRAQDPTGGKS